MALPVSLACQNTDRTRALIDGRVSIEGCAASYVASSPEEIFQRAFRHEEFDISELSLSTHLLTVARGESKYVGLPVFISRSFRHSAIYIRSDRGITSPEKLKGLRIGVPDFQQTAGVWVRGMLSEEYGVHSTDVTWLTGGLEETGRQARVPLKLPPELSVSPIGPDETLSGMLAAGTLDAVVAPRAPSCFGPKHGVVRLFPDYRAAEEAYFKKTGLFPLMHIIGIRRTLAEQHPWLPVNVYKAFQRAKAIAQQDVMATGVMQVTHPWIADEIKKIQALMGQDFWPYGVAANRGDIDALIRYSKTDGLITRVVEDGELFAPSTLAELRF